MAFNLLQHVLFASHTFNLLLFPLKEAFPEIFFWDNWQLPCYIYFDFLAVPKSSSSQVGFDFWKGKVARGKFGKYSGCWTKRVLCLAKKYCPSCAEWAGVLLLIGCMQLWPFPMNNPHVVFTLHLLISASYSLGEVGVFHCEKLILCFGVITTDPCFITCYDCFEEVFIILNTIKDLLYD